MSMADDFNEVIGDLLTEFPRALTFTSVTQGAYDATTGVAANPTTVDYKVTGTIIKYSERLVNGTTILAADRRCYIASRYLTVDPKIGDTILAGSDLYRVVERYLREISATNIVWELQIRR